MKLTHWFFTLLLLTSASVYAADSALREHERTFTNGNVFKDCLDCPEMVIIPAGSFDMGSNNHTKHEKPVHRVTISKPFAIGKTEVTRRQWKAVMGSNHKSVIDCRDTCPVEAITWQDTQEFILKLNAKTGQQYRLPSEAEWEYACRAGEQSKYCGSDNLSSVAWYKGNRPHPVGQKKANAFGLYDMSGNLWEWAQDKGHYDYNGAPTDGSVWVESETETGGHVLRGGCWGFGDLAASLLDAVVRDSYNIETDNEDSFYHGFRLAKTLP